MATLQFPIISGPEKGTLFEGLMCWYPRKPVVFGVKFPIGNTIEVFITGITAADGSGESWNIEGVVGQVDGLPLRTKKTDLFMLENGQRVSINFRTDRRQGRICLFPKGYHLNLAQLDQTVQLANEKRFGDGRPVRR